MDVDAIASISAQLDSPIWIVTAADGDRRGGLVATTVASASIVKEMPRQLVTIGKRHLTHELINASQAFALHLIDESQLDLVERFGTRTGHSTEKFADLEWKVAETGSPSISTALAWLDCRVETQMDIGDRTVFVGNVVTGDRVRTEAPLTMQRLLEIAPDSLKHTMREQRAHDAQLDAAAIQSWQEQRTT